MRLKTYLLEDIKINTLEEIVDNINNYCEYYLKYFNPSMYALHRGLKNIDGDYLKCNVNKNRSPMDLNSNIHNFLDNMFYEKYRN